ncbi:ParB N-terminal domain-containing protein [Gorillibacterium massiliense]|uniref:ParB N-terminal domain-containing protein n=1 Tax=Gorillibacterium massiliense TaxID=1280390 RepID=UPI0005932C08|nr:ParB N-terminal domain-containing protein [Gorillibacterium massiliense]
MRKYSFEEIEKIHEEAKGKIHAWNIDYQNNYFLKKSVNMNEVIQISLIKPEYFKLLPIDNEDRLTIESLILGYKNHDDIPPVILKMSHEGSYDIIDGLHRLSAMNMIGIIEFEAFVLVVESDKKSISCKGDGIC